MKQAKDRRITTKFEKSLFKVNGNKSAQQLLILINRPQPGLLSSDEFDQFSHPTPKQNKGL
jgi:hypothetical protein